MPGAWDTPYILCGLDGNVCDLGAVAVLPDLVELLKEVLVLPGPLVEAGALLERTD